MRFLPLDRNDCLLFGRGDEEAAAKPPLPTPLNHQQASHSDQREESPAHISNFTDKA
ncbi:hypothetical protein [Viscerimonas tarda]